MIVKKTITARDIERCPVLQKEDVGGCAYWMICTAEDSWEVFEQLSESAIEELLSLYDSYLYEVEKGGKK